MEESPTYGLFSESGYGYPPLTLFARRAYGPRALNWGWEGAVGVRVEEEEVGRHSVSRLDAQQGVPTTWL